MALKAISGASYHEAVKNVSTQRNETNAQANGSSITITEVPSAGKASAGARTSSGQNQSPVAEDQIKEAVMQANTKLRAHRTRCEFSYHEETNRVSIKVFDRDTEKLIREIPPEETLEMVEKMWEIAGLLVDEKR